MFLTFIHPTIHYVLLIQDWDIVAASYAGIFRDPSLQQHFPAPSAASWGIPRPDAWGVGVVAIGQLWALEQGP